MICPPVPYQRISWIPFWKGIDKLVDVVQIPTSGVYAPSLCMILASKYHLPVDVWLMFPLAPGPFGVNVTLRFPLLPDPK
jgi:hypothetical protein